MAKMRNLPNDGVYRFDGKRQSKLIPTETRLEEAERHIRQLTQLMQQFPDNDVYPRYYKTWIAIKEEELLKIQHKSEK